MTTNEWTFDQGPFDDALGGVTDSSGWIYQPAPQGFACFTCGELLTVEGGDWFCWACQNPVPWRWEQEHADGEILTLGLLTN